MIPSAATLPSKSRLAALLEHFAMVEDSRDVRRITHRLGEILLLVVCCTITDRGRDKRASRGNHASRAKLRRTSIRPGQPWSGKLSSAWFSTT
jgi:hypothetical protein